MHTKAPDRFRSRWRGRVRGVKYCEEIDLTNSLPSHPIAPMIAAPTIRFAPILLLSAAPLGAKQVPLPEGWPDAATVLERFKAGDGRHTSRSALGMCPKESPYEDQLWSTLLAEEPTPKLTMQLALAWAIALRDCNDPRIAAWYRNRLLQYRHDTFLVFALAHPLVSHRTPENLEAVKR